MKYTNLFLVLTFTSILSAYGADDQFADVLNVKTIDLETATKWCGGDQPLSGVEEIIQERKNRHMLPSSLRKYKKIYTGCVCPQGKVLFKFGQKDKQCPTPKTQEEICLQVVEPLIKKTTDLASDILRITTKVNPEAKLFKLPPTVTAEVVPEHEQVPVLVVKELNSESPLVNSNYVFTPEAKKKIIQQLPKPDLTMCKWGCKNTLTYDAIVWNLATINEAAQKLQGLNNQKILQFTLLTSNPDRQSNRDEVLGDVDDFFYPLYTQILDTVPASKQGIKKDYEWFKKNVAPYVKIKYVPDLKTSPDSPHFGFEYDFK